MRHATARQRRRTWHRRRGGRRPPPSARRVRRRAAQRSRRPPRQSRRRARPGARSATAAACGRWHDAARPARRRRRGGAQPSGNRRRRGRQGPNGPPVRRCGAPQRPPRPWPRPPVAEGVGPAGSAARPRVRPTPARSVLGGSGNPPRHPCGHRRAWQRGVASPLASDQRAAAGRDARRRASVQDGPGAVDSGAPRAGEPRRGGVARPEGGSGEGT